MESVKENQENFVKCVKCNLEKPSTDGRETRKGFVCNSCRKKKTILGWIITFLLLCIAGLIVWLCLVSSDNKRTAKGFDGVTEINDSINVHVDDSDVHFIMAKAVLTSTPTTTQAPIANIDDLKRIIKQSISEAEKNSSECISLPQIAVMFGLNSDLITPEAQNLITEVSKIYNETSQSSNIIVEGYGCNLGSDYANNHISELRAKAVKDALIANGVNGDKIKIIWFGKTQNSKFNLTSNEDYRRVLINFE